MTESIPDGSTTARDLAAPPGPVYAIGRAILRPFFALVFRPRILGRGAVPARGAVLIVSNHLSAWDTLLIPVSAPRRVQFLIKAAYFTGRGRLGAMKRWFFRSIGGVPVVRTAGRSAWAALEAGSEVLREGRVFAVFPEGTRSRDGLLHAGHLGAAKMALETGAAVVPIGLVGTDRMRPFRAWLPGGARPEVRYGAPVELGDLASGPGGVARREATERIMSAIAALSGQQRTDAVNPSSQD